MSCNATTSVLPCKKEACLIQTCLKDNDYQQDKCEDIINQMIKCCFSTPDASGLIHCSGFLKKPKQQKESSESDTSYQD